MSKDKVKYLPAVYKATTRIPCLESGCKSMVFTPDSSKPLCAQHWQKLNKEIRYPYSKISRKQPDRIIELNNYIGLHVFLKNIESVYS